MKKFAILILITALLSFAAACSSNSDSSGNKPATTNVDNKTANHGADHPTEKKDDTPAAVKAAFADAESFTTQHKDIPAAKIAEIEKESGGKVPDTDHHSYLAFKTEGGTKKQIGAATVIEAGGKSLVIVYESREGSPFIKDVRGESLPASFLAQFKGKGHDDKFDVKPEGVDAALAKTIAMAVRIDVLTMQELYGSAHTH